MAPATRTNSTTTEEILASLREPIAQLMREEMEKLREEMRTTAMEVSTSQMGRNQGDQRHNMQFTRVTKIEFPKFGGDDVKGWMYKCEQFFKVDNVPDEQKVPLISIHLFDIALMWHRQFMRLLGSDTVPWLVYRGAIMQRFGNSFDDPLGELKNCKYENSIEDYQNNFDKLLSRVDIREDQAISFYMAGLPTDIELAVRMFKPQTLSVAYSLSKLQIETNEATKKKNKAPLFPTPKFNSYTSGGSQISSPKPLALPAPNVNWRTKAATPHRRTRYVPGHKCTGQVYLLEVFLDEEESQEEEEIVFGTEGETSQLHQIFAEGPQISLHALNGIQSYQTLRVIGVSCSAQWMSGKQAAKTGNQASNLAMCVYPTAMLNMLSASVPTTENFGMPNTPSVLDPLIEEFADVFEVPNCLPPKRGHDHRIPLQEGTQPINIRPYRHPPTQKDAIESMVKELLDSGVIRHSQSSFSSPVVMVKKKDGSWRMCIDYRQLNKQTIKDKFPIPLIEELIDELHGSMVFSKLDLRSGYHQIRMFEDDIAKTAFKTHEGHYEFLVMPFGLTNAPSTFQALMNEVFRPFLRKFTLVFFDDILVYSPDIQSHVDHLRQILIVMREQQLYAKASKCTFGAQKVEYLGHIISGLGVSTDPHKIQAMVDWPVPTNLKQLRGFLGLTGYYRRFVKNYASISMPLTALLKKNAFGWNMEAQTAFEKLKSVMTQTPVLQLPDFNEVFIIETDASGIGIGAVLQQNGHPIAFLSKTLAPKHQVLSTYEKEFLAVIQALEKWRGYLLDRHFVIKTDHYSLKYLLDQRITTPAQMKWLPKLMGFDYEIVYKKGAENVVADALSMELMHHFHSGPTGGHSGMQATTKRMGALVYWKKMRSQIKQYIRQCDICQRYKPELVPYPGLLQPLPIPTMWAEISMDFIDGLPMSKERTSNCYWVHAKDHKTNESLADKHRSDREFEEGVWVYLKLQPYRQATLRQGKQHKLSPKYFGPFLIMKKVGKVAYKLQLPSSSQIHPVFHVSQLKLYRGPIPKSSSQLPQISKDGLISEEPFAVLDRKMAKKGNTAVVYVLIQWINGTAADATWETYESIAERFPHFDLNA
ncbi:putative mitochondrial protein [Tanacetum coccineum]